MLMKLTLICRTEPTTNLSALNCIISDETKKCIVPLKKILSYVIFKHEIELMEKHLDTVYLNSSSKKISMDNKTINNNYFDVVLSNL
jgi:hypothetical protein